MSDLLDFDIVDRPKDDNKETEQNKENIDVLAVLLSGKAITRKIKTSRGDFTVRYPTGHDRLKIDQRRAIRRRGIPAEAFDEFANYNNVVWSTLDVVVIDGPEWYQKTKENNPGWSWEEGPDEAHTIELYDLVGSFRTQITERIRESRLGKNAGECELPENTTSVDDGAFSGLTNGRKSTGAK